MSEIAKTNCGTTLRLAPKLNGYDDELVVIVEKCSEDDYQELFKGMLEEADNLGYDNVFPQSSFKDIENGLGYYETIQNKRTLRMYKLD